jgi:hypothetical protein
MLNVSFMEAPAMSIDSQHQAILRCYQPVERLL